MHELTSRGVGLKVLTGQGAPIDTTTAAGKLVFGIFAALAEFERELIRERTRAGLASARARGRKGGRPYKMTGAKLRLAMAAMGQPETKVADLCGNSASPGRPSTGTSAPKAPCALMAKSSLPTADAHLGGPAEAHFNNPLQFTLRNDTARANAGWRISENYILKYSLR